MRTTVVVSLAIILLLVPIASFGQQSLESSPKIADLMGKAWVAQPIAADPAIIQVGRGFYNASVNSGRTNGILMAPPTPPPPPISSIGERGAAIGFFSTSQTVKVRGEHTISPGVYVIVLRHIGNEWRIEYRTGKTTVAVGTTEPQRPPTLSPMPTVYWTSDGPCETWDSVTFC